MKNVFKVICKKCGGKCCKLNVMLTKKDLEKLKYKIYLKDFKKYGRWIYVHWGICPFLDIKKGCRLPEKLKPFDCKLFPLTFMYEKGKVNVFLNKKCPYTEEIPEKWINKAKKGVLKELKDWTKEEKETYTNLIKNHSSSKLVLLK
jgi:Fe-S-cluster containining protein